MVCGPGVIFSMAGAWPRSAESMKISAPSGSEVIEAVAALSPSAVTPAGGGSIFGAGALAAIGIGVDGGTRSFATAGCAGRPDGGAVPSREAAVGFPACTVQSWTIASQASCTEFPSERVDRLVSASPSWLNTAILFRRRRAPFPPS
jgi:hypothetical protein